MNGSDASSGMNGGSDIPVDCCNGLWETSGVGEASFVTIGEDSGSEEASNIGSASHMEPTSKVGEASKVGETSKVGQATADG